MKILAKLAILALSLLFFASCLAEALQSAPPPSTDKPVKTFNRKLHEPDEFKVGNHLEVGFYMKRNCWESPFNPHEVLRYWVKLHGQKTEDNRAIILVGNPKIDWSKIDLAKIDPTDVPIPEGEIASAVVFIFVQTGPKTIELGGYGYHNEYKTKILFRWEKGCYRKFPDPNTRNNILCFRGLD